LSDCIEEEICSMKIVDNNHRVACGTSDGNIALFKWDWFGDFKDRILGHPGSINTMAKVKENWLITGCEDGHLRFVSLLSKNIEKIIGDTKSTMKLDNKGFNDIEDISLDRSIHYFIIIGGKNVGIISHLDYVKVYDISNVNWDEGNNEQNNYKSDESDNEDDQSKEGK